MAPLSRETHRHSEFLSGLVPRRFRRPSIRGTNRFSAENTSLGKEVSNMTYCKPEISELSNAVAAVQAGDSLTISKSDIQEDGAGVDRMTPPAYSADE